jgi:hypothetical protein
MTEEEIRTLWYEFEPIVSQYAAIRFARALESRVLAERKPVATLHDDGHWTWKGTEPYESRFAGWRIDVFAHPTPDDAKDAARYRFLKAGAELSKWNGGWSSYWLIKSVDIPDGRRDMTLDAAIDRAMQDKEIGGMSDFNWEIGTVPKGWKREYGVRVQNGDFKHGPMAAISPGLIPPCEPIEFDTLCIVQFHYDQRFKVKAWLNWFSKEKHDD